MKLVGISILHGPVLLGNQWQAIGELRVAGFCSTASFWEIAQDPASRQAIGKLQFAESCSAETLARIHVGTAVVWQ